MHSIQNMYWECLIIRTTLNIRIIFVNFTELYPFLCLSYMDFVFLEGARSKLVLIFINNSKMDTTRSPLWFWSISTVCVGKKCHDLRASRQRLPVVLKDLTISTTLTFFMNLDSVCNTASIPQACRVGWGTPFVAECQVCLDRMKE